MTVNKRIYTYLSDQRTEMIACLEKLVTAESPSLEPASQEQILTMISENLLELDFDVSLVPGRKTGGYLLAVQKSNSADNPQQLLLGHCDTIWPLGTLEEMPFEVSENIVQGPGAYDMKGGLTQMLFALKAIRDLALEPSLSPTILINSDEEIGSPESGPTIMNLSKIAKRAYVLEPSLGLEGKLKTARKGVGQYEIVIDGRAAHAGLDPSKGISAVVELAHQILHLDALNDYDQGVSVNVGTVEGGLRANVVAPQCKASVDVRVPTMEKAQEIDLTIHGLRPVIPGTSLTINGGLNRPPLEQTPENQKLWLLAKQLGESMGLSLEQGTAGGGSDGNTTSQYTATLDGLGAVGDGAHARHEFIYIDKMVERAALLVLLLLAP